MSLRHGVTATEEHKLKSLIAKGWTWERLVAACQVQDEQGKDQSPLLADVNLDAVKKNVWDPLVKRHEEAKKAGHKDIHALDAAEKKRREAAAAAKKAKENE